MCICGKQEEFRIGTIKRRGVIVYNVPHFYCSDCNEISYDLNTKISSCVAYAYKNNITEIDWEEWNQEYK